MKHSQQRRVLSGFPCIWFAILALLFTSCASLTPERIAILAAIAGQAAQIGAQQWLATHPEHRAAFDAVITAIRALVAQGTTNPNAYVELLESLPTSKLAAPSGELMWSGRPKDGHGVAAILVWDGELAKPVVIEEAAVLPVMKAATAGLKRATAPMPPPIPKKKLYE
jgi:hypothetical protein